MPLTAAMSRKLVGTVDPVQKGRFMCTAAFQCSSSGIVMSFAFLFVLLPHIISASNWPSRHLKCAVFCPCSRCVPARFLLRAGGSCLYADFLIVNSSFAATFLAFASISKRTLAATSREQGWTLSESPL